MSLWKKSVFFGSVTVLIFAWMLWPRVPDNFENPEFLRISLPAGKILNFLIMTMHRFKVRNPFILLDKALQHAQNSDKSPPSELVTIAERHLQGVRTLVFTPKAPKNQAAVLFFHGGGYVMGTPEQYTKLTTALAEQLGCVVISVDYRLAPQHIHPAWQEDSRKVTQFILEEGHKEFNVDPKKVFLMGDSAGGHIVAALGLQFPSVKAIVLLYPITQHLTYSTPSYLENADFVLARKSIPMFALLYFQGNANDNFDAILADKHSGMALRQEYADKFELPELTHPKGSNGKGDSQLMQRYKHMYEDALNSPLFADLSQYPPSFMVTCQFDVLRDDGVMFVRRLQKAQREVKHLNVNTFHGFMNFVDQYAPAGRTFNDVVAFLKTHL